MKRLPAIALVAGLAALLPVQAHAQTQAAKACLTEREVAHMAIYSVPALVDGVRGKCAAKLSPTGFLATKGDEFAAKYAALQNETWPVAKAGITKFVGGTPGNAKANDLIKNVLSMPDQSLRTMADLLIAQKIGESIKPASCANVERGMQLASVMNPRDSGAMIAFVMAMAKPKSAPICPAKP